jgi:hypothetical protein
MVIDWSHVHNHEFIKILDIIEKLSEFSLTSGPLQMHDRCQIAFVYWQKKIRELAAIEIDAAVLAIVINRLENVVEWR